MMVVGKGRGRNINNDRLVYINVDDSPAPIPELPASAFKVAGGSLYPGTNGLDRKMNRNQFMLEPRFAVAYQLHPKTVLRAGYGVY